MANLLKLEIRRDRLTSYIIASIIVFAGIAAIVLVAAFDESDLATYASLINLTSILTMISFAIVSSVMYAKFLIGEYHGEARILLFSYPVKRSKILITKVSLVFGFTVLATMLSNAFTFVILYYTESMNNVIQDHFTTEALFMMIRYTLLATTASGIFGFIAFLIGFWMKSVPAAIVSAVIIGTALNSVVGMATPQTIIIGFLGFVAIGFILMLVLIRRVNNLEVD